MFFFFFFFFFFCKFGCKFTKTYFKSYICLSEHFFLHVTCVTTYNYWNRSFIVLRVLFSVGNQGRNKLFLCRLLSYAYNWTFLSIFWVTKPLILCKSSNMQYGHLYEYQLIYIYNCLKVPQSQTAANPQHQEKETNGKNKHALNKQTHVWEAHRPAPLFPQRGDHDAKRKDKTRWQRAREDFKTWSGP